MKLRQEDGPLSPTDDYHALIVAMWKLDISANLVVADQVMRIIPVPPPFIEEQCKKFYDRLSYDLPGICDHCSLWCMERIETYWSAHSHLCWKCTAWAVSYFENKGQWPEATWHPGEENLDFPEQQ